MKPRTMVTFALALFMLVPASLFASSHREAPISALDHAADVTDWYAFVSYDQVSSAKAPYRQPGSRRSTEIHWGS